MEFRPQSEEKKEKKFFKESVDLLAKLIEAEKNSVKKKEIYFMSREEIYRVLSLVCAKSLQLIAEGDYDIKNGKDQVEALEETVPIVIGEAFNHPICCTIETGEKQVRIPDIDLFFVDKDLLISLAMIYHTSSYDISGDFLNRMEKKIKNESKNVKYLLDGVIESCREVIEFCKSRDKKEFDSSEIIGDMDKILKEIGGK